MRILAIALAALLVAGCNVPDADVSATTTPSRSTTIPEREDPDLVPERFRGDYAADTPACSTSAHESRLTIGAWRIRFHESSGAITAVDAGEGGDIAITAELTGEGETREATYRFNLSDDGQTLTDTDSGMTRRRC